MYMWTYKSNLLSLATMVISNVFLWCKQRKYVQPAPIIQVEEIENDVAATLAEPPAFGLF